LVFIASRDAVPRAYALAGLLQLVHAELSLDNSLVIGQDTRLNWNAVPTDPTYAAKQARADLHENYWYPSFPSELLPVRLTTFLCAEPVGCFPAEQSEDQRPRSVWFPCFNLVLHALNAMLVLVIARRLTGRPWLALLAAALFAVASG